MAEAEMAPNPLVGDQSVNVGYTEEKGKAPVPRLAIVPASSAWLFYQNQQIVGELKAIKGMLVFFTILAVIVLLFAGCNAIMSIGG